jgi:hypothetical protein
VDREPKAAQEWLTTSVFRRWVFLLGVLALLTTGCSSTASDPTATTIAGTGTTSAPSTTVATTGTIAAGGAWRPWWITGDTVSPGDPRLPTGGDDIRAALDAVLAGPTAGESSFGNGNDIASTVTINSLVVTPDGIATVDFNRKFETDDTRPQTAQVVYTLTQFPQVTKVRFLIDGEPNGATGVPPIGRSDLSFPTAAG